MSASAPPARPSATENVSASRLTGSPSYEELSRDKRRPAVVEAAAEHAVAVNETDRLLQRRLCIRDVVCARRAGGVIDCRLRACPGLSDVQRRSRVGDAAVHVHGDARTQLDHLPLGSARGRAARAASAAECFSGRGGPQRTLVGDADERRPGPGETQTPQPRIRTVGEEQQLLWLPARSDRRARAQPGRCRGPVQKTRKRQAAR